MADDFWQRAVAAVLLLALTACGPVPAHRPAPVRAAAPPPAPPRTPTAPLPALPVLAHQQAPPPAEAPGNAMQHAHASLARAENRIGLSAAELARLDRAKRKLLAGDAGPLETLDAELAAATGTYTVHGGGSLADVAARPGVYGNASLWPLIWRANQDQPKPPAMLGAGARLSFPVHPTAEEAAAAINEAGGGATGTSSAAPAWP